MTATVTPPGDAIKLRRSDPALRLTDYAVALSHYITFLEQGVVSGIVFAENSGSDISSLILQANLSKVRERIEFVQFQGLDHPGSFGRGYGEFKLLDFAMQKSRIISATGDDAEIWKVTGRYRVVNLAQLLARRPRERLLWVHCRNVPSKWADMYLLGWRRDFYAAHIAGIYERLNESTLNVSAEVVFRAIVDELAADRNICQRLHPPPELQGVRGLDSVNYGDRRIRRVVRSIADRILPSLWI